VVQSLFFLFAEFAKQSLFQMNISTELSAPSNTIPSARETDLAELIREVVREELARSTSLRDDSEQAISQERSDIWLDYTHLSLQEFEDRLFGQGSTPWHIDFQSVDHSQIVNLTAGPVSVPIVDSEVYAFIKKDKVAKAKVDAFRSGQLAIRNLVNAALMVTRQADNVDGPLQKSLKALILLSAMEMTKIASEIRNVGRMAMDAPKDPLFEQLTICTNKDVEIAREKVKEQQQEKLLKSVARSTQTNRNYFYKRKQRENFYSANKRRREEDDSDQGGRVPGRGRNGGGRGQWGRKNTLSRK
jgi:hypothetical protein